MLSAGLSPAAYRWVPPHDATNGDLAADLGVELGLVPDEDQRDILNATFAYNEADPAMPVCSTVGVVGPRQNIKTSTFEIAALTDLFVFREPLHVWTAHLTKTSRKTFEHMCMLIDSNRELKSMCRDHRTANGSEAIELKTGERVEFYARSKKGGRGITSRKITMDEALFLEPADMGALGPTMVTIPDAQIRYGSSAGMAMSEVLRGIRDRGQSLTDPRMAYFEWAADRVKCEQDNCPHLPVDEVPGCALDRRDLWAQANPAYGRRITEDALVEQRKMLAPEEFMREFLGWWEDPTGLANGIPVDIWDRLNDPRSEIVGVPSLAVAMPPDLSTVCLAAVGKRRDGQWHVEIVEHGVEGSWFVPRVAAVARNQSAKVWLHPGHPEGSLYADLQAADATVQTLNGTEYGQAAGALYRAALAGTIHYRGPQPELRGAVERAGRRDNGTWDGDHITALVAATKALHGAQNATQGGWAVSL